MPNPPSPSATKIKESDLLDAFLAAWKAHDKQAVQLRAQLSGAGRSADSLALGACFDLERGRYYASGQELQRTLDQARTERSSLGYTRHRPAVMAALETAQRQVTQDLAAHPDSPGLRWLAGLAAACTDQPQAATEVLGEVEKSPAPRWLRSRVRCLRSHLEFLTGLSRYPLESEAHRALVAGFNCPLLQVQGGIPQCGASVAVDAPTQPEDGASCADGLWAHCPYMARAVAARSPGAKGKEALNRTLETAKQSLEAGQHDKAATLAEAAAQTDPLEFQSHYLWAMTCRARKQFGEAYRRAAIAAALQPKNPALPALLSVLSLELNQPVLAEYHAGRALQLEPAHGEALYLKAEALKAQGRQAEAVTHYERACASAPIQQEWRYALACSLAWLGRFKDAKAEAEKLEAAAKNAKHTGLLAELNRQLEADHQARAEARLRLEARGGAEAAWPRLNSELERASYAHDLLLEERAADCQTVLRWLADQDANQPLIPLIKGASFYLFRQGTADLEQAVPYLEAGLAERTNEPGLVARFGLLAARAYFHLGQYQKALDWALTIARARAWDNPALPMIPQLLHLLGKKDTDVSQVLRPLHWDCFGRFVPPAAAIGAVPMLLLVFLPLGVGWQLLLTLVLAGGAAVALNHFYGKRVPRVFQESFAMYVMGAAGVVTGLAALIWVNGFFSRLFAAAWYGAFAAESGCVLEPDQKAEAPENAEKAPPWLAG